MTFIPFPEYRPDVNDYQGQHTQTLSGVLPRGDGWGPVANLQAFTQALPGACRGFFYGRKTDGTIAVFAATSTRIYQLNNTTLAWSDVSKGGIAYSTVPSTDQWQFVQYGDSVIAAQANTVPQTFTLSSSTNFADLGGSPPASKGVSVIGRFLVLTGIGGNLRRIQWSDLDGITTWTAGTGFSNYVDLPDGGDVLGAAGGEFGLVFQESVVRRLVYVPGAKPAFQIERVTEDKGLIGTYSVCRAGDKIFFLAQQGFFEYTPGAGIIPIGKERVDRTILADIDLGSTFLLIGASDPSSTRVYWAYKSLRSSNTAAFDTLICYDYGLERWSPPLAISGEYISSLVKPGLTLDGLDSISSSLDALTFSLDTVQAAIVSKFAAFTTGHALGFFDGSNIEAALETPEQALEGQYVRVKGLFPRTDATSVYGSIKWRWNAQAALNQTSETAIDIYGNCQQNLATKLARARVRIPAGTTWTYCMGVEPEFASTGSRL